MLKLRVFAAMLLSVVVLFTGCASRDGVQAQRIVGKDIRRIVLVQPREYMEFSADSKNGVGLLLPLAGAAMWGYAKSKQAEVAAVVQPGSLRLAETFTSEVAEGLRGVGYEVEVLKNAERDEDIDASAVDVQADAVVEISIHQVGVYAGLLGSYEPTMTTQGDIYLKPSNKYVNRVALYYGAHARSGKDWAVMAEKEYAYRDLEDVMKRADHVREGLRSGIKPLATKMTRQITEQLRQARL